MSYDFLGDIDRIGMDAYKQGEEDAKKRAIEILASVLEIGYMVVMQTVSLPNLKKN